MREWDRSCRVDGASWEAQGAGLDSGWSNSQVFRHICLITYWSMFRDLLKTKPYLIKSHMNIQLVNWAKCHIVNFEFTGWVWIKNLQYDKFKIYNIAEAQQYRATYICFTCSKKSCSATFRLAILWSLSKKFTMPNAMNFYAKIPLQKWPDTISARLTHTPFQ